jgi:E3 ubiquitin-protein ligase NEDD4
MAPSEVEQRQLQLLSEQRRQLESRTLPETPQLIDNTPSQQAPAQVLEPTSNLGPSIIKLRPQDFESFVRDSVKRLGELPDGFEVRLDELGRVYFADHIHQTTSWDDPRLPSSADASAPEYRRDFQRKLTYFRSQPEMRLRKGKVNIDIRRESVLEDSFERIMKLSGEELKQRLNIRFDGEEGLDYGGVAREFFFLLSHEVFSPAYCLFEYSSHANYTLQISPRSNINPEHLEYFRFIGRLIGLAIFHQKFVDAFFVSSFYKQILGMEIALEDMESVDADVYKNLQWMLDNDVEGVGAVFAVDDDQFGVIVEEDLIPNGRNIPVSNKNKTEYVDLLVKWRVVTRVEGQMQAFLSGLFDIIPRTLLSIFDDREMELLIGGIAEIDVDDWVANTVYRDCTYEDKLIGWFWRCIRESFDNEKRARLLQFATGTSRVPVNGFKDLQGSDGPRKFCIQKMASWSSKSLPKSHTCFNRIDLPPYTDYWELVEKLTMAIEETIGFAQE